MNEQMNIEEYIAKYPERVIDKISIDNIMNKIDNLNSEYKIEYKGVIIPDCKLHGSCDKSSDLWEIIFNTIKDEVFAYYSMIIITKNMTDMEKVSSLVELKRETSIDSNYKFIGI